MNYTTQMIAEHLRDIERQESVKILYACESGSRAWGFASRNSDWDVRFIYVRKLEWYLSVNAERKRDVIEFPIVDDLDVNGWDIRKALWLLRKSNPPLLEWIHSPITYLQHTPFIARLNDLISTYCSPRACHHHHLNMAKHNYRECIRGDQVRLKKFLYVLRPLLAVNWIEQNRGSVPVEFATLLDCLRDNDVKKEIDILVQRKIAGDELDTGKRIDTLNHYIEAEMNRLAKVSGPGEPPHPDLEPLDTLFRATLAEVWETA